MKSFFVYEKDDLDSKIKSAQCALENLAEESKKIQETLTQQTGKAQALKSIRITGRWHSEIMYYNKDRWNKENWQLAVKNAKTEIESMRREIESQHKANIPIIESNKAALKALCRFMEQIGFPRQWTEYKYKTTRSRNQTPHKHNAGWLEDSYRWLRCDDAYDREIKQLDSLTKQINEFEKKRKQEDVQKERAKKKLEEKKRKERVVPVLIGKYGLDIDSEINDVLDEILNRDKYLCLAHYMLQNRNDWNDGHDSASYGLLRFSIETPKDEEIYDDIQECIDNWDNDGRVFRDTEWNYSKIFALASAELYADYHTITELLDK